MPPDQNGGGPAPSEVLAGAVVGAVGRLRLAHHPRLRPAAGTTGPSSARPAAGSARRISSSCARAAICCAMSAVWMPWNSPSSQPTSWAWAMRSSASDGVCPSPNGRAIRRSSSTSSGARPCSSSCSERSWIAASRLRPASSSGALRTSSSSCLIMLPIRITFAGCSTSSAGLRSSSSSSSPPGVAAMPMPSGVTTTMRPWSSRDEPVSRSSCVGARSRCLARASSDSLMGPSCRGIGARAQSRGRGTFSPRPCRRPGGPWEQHLSDSERSAGGGHELRAAGPTSRAAPGWSSGTTRAARPERQCAGPRPRQRPPGSDLTSSWRGRPSRAASEDAPAATGRSRRPTTPSRSTRGHRR